MDIESRLARLEKDINFLYGALDSNRGSNLQYNRIMTVVLVANLLLQILILVLRL